MWALRRVRQTTDERSPSNVAALADLPGQWIDAVHQRRQPKVIVLDMDSSDSPTYGEQRKAPRSGPNMTTITDHITLEAIQ
jgi:hypothetical protein